MNNKIKAKLNKFFTLFFLLVFLNQCVMGADARKYPPEPEKRVQKNMEEGRGFRLMGGEKEIVVEILSLLALIHYGEQP